MKPQWQWRVSDLLAIFQEGSLKPDSIDIELKNKSLYGYRP